MNPTSEDLAVLRTLIPDDAAVFGPAEDQYMFSDDQLGHFYKVGNGSPLRAAALANYALASSEALISKVIKTQDLATDGAKVAQALITKADALMKQADNADASADNAYFEIIDYGWGDYSPELTEGTWRL